MRQGRRRVRGSPPSTTTAGQLALVVLALATATVALVHGRRHAARRPPERPPVVIVSGTTTTLSAVPAAPGPLAVSREFVDAYAGFIYGHVPGARLPHVSAYLRGRLAAEHPNPPAAVAAAADARLSSLRLSADSGTAAGTVALIADGASAYELRLALRRVRGQWTITALTETG